MIRLLLSLVFAVAVAAANWLEQSGHLPWLTENWRAGLADPAVAQNEVVLVEVAEESISALDAALVVRAAQNHGPHAVVVQGLPEENENFPLLQSRISSISFPVVFVEGGTAQTIDGEAFSGSIFGSTGTPTGRVQAETRITLEDLMIAGMRAEEGLINPAQDSLFRGRVVAIAPVGNVALPVLVAPGHGRTTAVAETPLWSIVLPVFLALTVPFWPGAQGDRFFEATVFLGLWLLTSFGLAHDSGVILPIAGPLVLSLLALLRR